MQNIYGIDGRAHPTSNMRTHVEQFLKTMCDALACSAHVIKHPFSSVSITNPARVDQKRFFSQKESCPGKCSCFWFGAKFVVLSATQGLASDDASMSLWHIQDLDCDSFRLSLLWDHFDTPSSNSV